MPIEEEIGLANVANTILFLLGLKTRDVYLPSIIRES